MSEDNVAQTFPLNSAVPNASDGIIPAQTAVNVLLDTVLSAPSPVSSGQSAADALRSLPVQRTPRD